MKRRPQAEAPLRWSRGRAIPDRPQGTSASGVIPKRRLARGSSTGARSCAFARGDHIREGWPPHERTVHDGTASPAKVKARFAAPTTGEEATQRGDPERGEGRGTPRPPGRGGARGATGPRARALRSSAPEAAEGQRREPAARADPAQQSRGPEGRSERSEARAPRRAPARGRRGTDRHPRVTCQVPPGQGERAAPGRLRFERRRFIRPWPGATEGAQASEAAEADHPPHTGRGAAAVTPVAEAQLCPQPWSPGLARESRAGRGALCSEARCTSRQRGREPEQPSQDARAEQCDPTVEQTRGSPEPRTATSQRPSGATPYGASRKRLPDERDTTVRGREAYGGSRGWRWGAKEKGLRAVIMSFQDRSEPIRGAREGAEVRGAQRSWPRRGCVHPRDGRRGPIPKRAREREPGVVAQRTRSGPQRQVGRGRGDAARLPARSSSRGERVAGKQRTNRDSGSSTARAETRRTSRPAAGRNRPVAPEWRKPSGRGGTAKAERDSTLGSVGPKGAPVPGSGHSVRMSVERRGVSEPQERRARAQRVSSALKGRSGWRGPALGHS